MELVRDACRTMIGDGRISLMVFTRDLRVDDNPALTAASKEGKVVCAFVHDDALRAARSMSGRRVEFLRDCLDDLDASLRRIGSWLEERRGDWVGEVLSLVAETGARTIHLSDDVTPYARRRLARLEAAAGRSVQVCKSPGLTIVVPGSIRPAGGDCYRVFTPFYRRWLSIPRRPRLGVPAVVAAPSTPAARQGSRLSGAARTGPPFPGTGMGGERAAAARLQAWRAGAIARYEDHRDDLDQPSTSRLSADLHFGCLSPLVVESAVVGRPGEEPFRRQLCWRDFYLQILAARPEAAWSGYLPGRREARHDPVALEAWRDGRTGVPVVDAAMRQLAEEGFLPNRARMIAASFLTRNMGLDWRYGAGHFLRELVDADLALNNLNWQWTAGLGTGANPHRVLNPTRQARRFDPFGAYVRRHVPELSALGPDVIHEPWRLGRHEIARLGYPAPVAPLAGAPE